MSGEKRTNLGPGGREVLGVQLTSLPEEQLSRWNRMTEDAQSRVSPKNDEIGRNTEYLENS